MNVLWIDACARAESRTRKLAQAVIDRLGGTCTHVYLQDDLLPPLNEERLAWRMGCCENRQFADPYFDWAKTFAAADVIVVAAPYWDNSFPAVLKKYWETVTVPGLTFCYTPEGIPRGLCKAKKLYYVTTAGGPVYNDAFGYGYVESLAKGLYGIAETACIKAENLDIIGNDAEQLLAEARERMAL